MSILKIIICLKKILNICNISSMVFTILGRMINIDKLISITTTFRCL